MKIDDIIDGLENVLNQSSRELPQMKAMGILKDNLLDCCVPIKYMGRIKIDIDDTFFNDEEKANAVLKNFATLISNIYHIIIEDYGEDADRIFGDVLSGMGMTCRNDVVEDERLKLQNNNECIKCEPLDAYRYDNIN